MVAEWQMKYASWLDFPYWELEQAVIWNCPPGGRLPIDQLLRGLEEGRIAATGRRVIYEDIPDSPLSSRPPKLGDREDIPALAWLDLTIIGSDYDGDLYVFEWDDGHRRLAWRQVRIKREDVLAFWGPPDAASAQQPAVRSGLPGRPTSKHLYLEMLAARIETGEIESSLEREAKFLKDWMEKTHPREPSSGPSAIKNAIRTRYNEAKRRA
jgi:hypothetical protein